MQHLTTPDVLPADAAQAIRVNELADLSRVFEPQVQVCAFPRMLDPAIADYLHGLDQTQELQLIETVAADAAPVLSRLPDKPGREVLVQDLLLLRDIVCELHDSDGVGLRLARVGQAMCPGWHLDRVRIRLVCTYEGIGTQWFPDQAVSRGDLTQLLTDEPPGQATAGEIVLLKGALWPGNEALGAVHRSPDVEPSAGLRTVVTLDPLWN